MESVSEALQVGAIILVFAVTLSVYLYAVISIHKTKFSSYREKAKWLTIVIAAPFIGSLLYLFNKPKRSLQSRIY